jgi:AGCS family alanine or glycine:cation symporter
VAAPLLGQSTNTLSIAEAALESAAATPAGGVWETVVALNGDLNGIVWGLPLLFLLLGGGAFLAVLARGQPFLRVGHAIALLRGKHEIDVRAAGQISHFQALSTALSSTIGLGNIGGVAIAISQGGPGAVFWMWIAAFLGMATKFFTCTLAVMYRDGDRGGPMYYIEKGLGPKWRWMAVAFSVFGMMGCLAMFQTNQLAEILAAGYAPEGGEMRLRIGVGVVSAAVVAVVIFGGLKRIANVASTLVPVMCAIYLVAVLGIIGLNIAELPATFVLIVHAAFNPEAALGAGSGLTFLLVLRTGIKRAAFSNEAGVGTAPMAHGAARTHEPVREGLVAMLGPFIDTIIVCSLTAFAILLAGDWNVEGVSGVSMTMTAFESSFGAPGKLLLTIVVLMFSFSTMFGYSYYGRTCFEYLFGNERSWIYNVIFVVTLFIGAVLSASFVVDLLDTSFGLMAFPNMLATIILAPRVVTAAKDYFRRMDAAAP